MNICFLCNGFSTNGGIGRVTSILGDALDRSPEYSVFLCSFYENKTDKYYASFGNVERYELFSEPVTMTKAMLFGGAIRKLRSYLREKKIDVIVACGALYFPIAIQAAKHSGIKTVCWEHISPTVNTDYKFQKQARMYGTRRCDCNVVLTKAALEWYKKNAKYKDIVQIYNPIDPIFDQVGDISYSLASKKIVSVGRLSYQKNFDRLLDIAKAVLPHNPGWTWDIYGDGEERENLERKIKDLGLQESVFLKGQVTDMYDRYNQYAMYVMTSRYEGFPMVLLEAARCGLPMVSFDIATGPNEIIKDQINGCLIDKSSNDGMIEAIDKLIEDPELRERMSDESIETSRQFSIDTIIGQWRNLFQSLMKGESIK